MFLYKKIENIMLTYFSNQMFHQPINELIYQSKVITRKFRFPCKIEHQMQVENVNVFLHYYGIKYKKVILYFPGGSFNDAPTILHYKFAKKISKRLKAKVIMFQYPLFPEVNPKETTQLIKKIIKHLKIKDFSLMGDSAGANLAIYLLESFHIDNKNIIDKTILISPFIDASLNNAYINIIDSHDFVLDKNNCYKMGKYLYSKYLNGNMYLFPKNSNFKFNNKVLLINGENEIFTYDAFKWMESQRILKVKQLIYKKMCHCFVIFPIIEAKKAVNEIRKFYLENIDN